MALAATVHVNSIFELKPDCTADDLCSPFDADIFGVDNQIILGGIGNVGIKILSDKRAAV